MLSVVVGVVLFGSVYTTALNKLYSSGEATFTSHLAHTLYGLAHGSNYEQADEDLSDEPSRPETEVSAGLWRRALQQIAAHPRVSRFPGTTNRAFSRRRPSR